MIAHRPEVFFIRGSSVPILTNHLHCETIVTKAVNMNETAGGETMPRTLSSVIRFLCCFFASTVAGQQLNGEITQWDTAGYRAYDIEATDDGYLWFTHTIAVVRFDPSTGATLGYYPSGTGKNFQTIDADSSGNLCSYTIDLYGDCFKLSAVFHSCFPYPSIHSRTV